MDRHLKNLTRAQQPVHTTIIEIKATTTEMTNSPTVRSLRSILSLIIIVNFYLPSELNYLFAREKKGSNLNEEKEDKIVNGRKIRKSKSS